MAFTKKAGSTSKSGGYDNTNRGVLFENEKTKENSPDYTGNINIDGDERRIAAWVKTSKDGSKQFLSIKVNDAE